MANDLLKTLQSMEAELAAIKSAKEQVEAAVAADAAINTSLKSYSSSLSSLSIKLGEVKDSLKDVAITVTDAASKFNASLEERKTDIENATRNLSELLADFKKQTEILGIKAIAEKTGHIEAICEGLFEKLGEIEIKLNKTKTDIQAITNSTTIIKQNIFSYKNEIIADVDTKVSTISSSISSSESNIKSALSSTGSTIMSKIDSSNSAHENSINKGVQSLEKDISSAEKGVKEAIASTDKKLMYMGVAIIILVLIDIILRFV